MTPCFFLQSYKSLQIEQNWAVLKTAVLSVQTYSFLPMIQGGSRGTPRASEAGGGGLPPAMLACPESEHSSDCRLHPSNCPFLSSLSFAEERKILCGLTCRLILGTVLFGTHEPQSVQTRGFVFSANWKLLYR